MSRRGGKLGNDAKLQLYGLFKQATVGPCTAPRPSLIDMTGRAKWCVPGQSKCIHTHIYSATFSELPTTIAAGAHLSWPFE